MQLDDWTLRTISGGRFLTDGGTMFAVVPKPLWSRKVTPDPLNRIQQATNCLLVQTGEVNVLIDTGYGSKLTDKQRKLHGSEAGDPLESSLVAGGISRDQVHLVILTHLHFDHAGGLTRKHEDGTLELEFPNAEVIVQRGEWETARANRPELRGVYTEENLIPLADSDNLRLIDGDLDILPGIRVLVTGGHTEFHQAVVIEYAGETLVYLGDICPTHWHLPTAWCIGYDLFQLQTRRIKQQLLPEIARNGWWALFDHDPKYAAAKLTLDDRGETAIGETQVRV
jgi:glyoxylase-like metal-dependent hydrolase (beta-lactamase superfamily II)